MYQRNWMLVFWLVSRRTVALDLTRLSKRIQAVFFNGPLNSNFKNLVMPKWVENTKHFKFNTKVLKLSRNKKDLNGAAVTSSRSFLFRDYFRSGIFRTSALAVKRVTKKQKTKVLLFYKKPLKGDSNITSEMY